MKTLLSIAAGAIALIGTATAGTFTLDFGATSTTSNATLTGAAGTATFDLTDEGGDVRIIVTIENTTGQTAFGDGATSSRLTGFGFDLLDGMTVLSSVTTGALGTVIAGASFQPFGTLDFAVADNANFNGGNPNSALLPGEVSTVSLLVDAALDADGLMGALVAAFFAGDLDAGMRFQAVNAGAGSDKLLFSADAVPLPGAMVLMMSALGAGAAGRKLRRGRHPLRVRGWVTVGRKPHCAGRL